MKVLMVNKFLFKNGGSETYMFSIGNKLEELGHEVQYFGMDHEKNCAKNRLGIYTKNMDFHGGSLINKLLYPIKTIYSFEARKKIRKVLNDFSPDVLHINNFNYQLTPSIILEIDKWRKISKKKCLIIYTAHDYQLICPNHMLYIPIKHELCDKCTRGKYLNCYKNKCIHNSNLKSLVGSFEGLYWKKKKVYKKIDKIICCSNFVKTKLDCNPFLKEKTITLLNFVSDIKPQKYKKENYVLFFGRFSEEKGIKTIIKVCKELKDINFIFAGSGPLEEEINSIPNINNVGFKTGKELYDIIEKAKISIVPSEWYEPFGLTIVESQKLGTPVIGSYIGGIPEIIKNGWNGVTFKPGDSEQLRRIIEDLYKNNDKCSQLSYNCIKSEYETVDKYVNKLLNIYGGKQL